VCSGRLDISLSGVLASKNKGEKMMIFCFAGTCPRGPKSPVQSGLDVTDPVQNRLDVKGSVQSRIDVFV
jgi:hypothetical protein